MRSRRSSASSTRCAATPNFGRIALAAAAVLALRGIALAQSESPSLPRCVEAEAVTLGKIDSATSTAGDPFTFKIVDLVAATAMTPKITPGTRGVGIVSFADHAHGAGQPGRLVVEPRFLRLPSGAHVQVLADPQVSDNFAIGKTRNINGALSFVPGLGLAVDGYNVLHRGREVSIPKGTTFNLLVGDGLALGECYVAPPDALNVR